MSDHDESDSEQPDDGGVHFGAVREATPVARRRPDRDLHYAVSPVGQPAANDLPIFVEVDAWRELIEHARGDTTVELGGVLLGGVFLDERQQPFVLVTDSLRAEHYEATRGSFKFTHDTWETITRRRAEFNGDVRMAGWYHTHPDWGVFLSSMDLFICDHFFAKLLDVALVLDPCRADWGWFQWTGRAGEPPRRTGGFFLVAARNRQAELANWAAIFSPEGDITMPADTRWSTTPTAAGAIPPPVVHIHQPAGSFQQQLPWLLMVLLQTLLVAVIGWRLTASAPAGTAGTIPAATDDSLQRWLAAQRSEAREAAQGELMDRVLADLASAPEGTFQQLTELQTENDELTSSLRAQQSRERELLAQQASQARQAERDRRTLQTQIAELTSQQSRLREQLNSSNEKLTKVSERLKSLEPDTRGGEGEREGDAVAGLPWYRSPLVMSVGAVIAVLTLVAAWWSQQRRQALADESEASP